jgi:hypothetical protein
MLKQALQPVKTGLLAGISRLLSYHDARVRKSAILCTNSRSSSHMKAPSRADPTMRNLELTRSCSTRFFDAADEAAQYAATEIAAPPTNRANPRLASSPRGTPDHINYSADLRPDRDSNAGPTA